MAKLVSLIVFLVVFLVVGLTLEFALKRFLEWRFKVNIGYAPRASGERGWIRWMIAGSSSRSQRLWFEAIRIMGFVFGMFVSGVVAQHVLAILTQ